jgi:hypothetical protein
MTAPEPAALQAHAAALQVRGAAPAYYIYWFPASATGGARPVPARQRTLVAFPSPDAALAFAQHGLQRDHATPPRLRRLALPQLLEAMLREPAISALLLVAEDAPLPAPGQLPAGVTVARAELLR